MTREISLLAPAKVNFRLDVLRKRPDGYHDLRMIMQRVGLYDELHLAVTDTPGISLTCPGSHDIPIDDRNLAGKAARTILAAAGCDCGVRITLRKNIPIAAGLGGGSSDAAAVLMGLNDLLGLGFSDERLRELARPLGADVPFFVFREPALAEGIGDRLTPLAGIPRLWLLLVNPGFGISTAWVYGNLGLTTDKVVAKLPFLYKSADDVCRILANDLETVALASYPLIGEIKKRLVAAGAAGALMSGSGATVFGIFPDEASAHAGLARFNAPPEWFTAVAPTI